MSLKEIENLHAPEASIFRRGSNIQMDKASTSSSSSLAAASSVQLGGRAIDRHNPIITDSRRTTISSKPALDTRLPSSSDDPAIQPKLHLQQLDGFTKRISSSPKPPPGDYKKKHSSPKHQSDNKKDAVKISSMLLSKQKDAVKKSVALPGDFSTPPGSSRYLLSDTVPFDDDRVFSNLVSDEAKKSLTLDRYGHFSNNPSSSHLKSASEKVVVLRVSIHCRGCEGKVRKHLSKMPGVTSFNIDSAAKKVTVVGDVTPLGVLASVSKVKTAKFWPFAASPTSTTNLSDTKV